MSEWIKCSEKMPEDGLIVWVTIKGYDFIHLLDDETLEEAIERTNKERWVTRAFWSEEEKGWCDADFGGPLINKPIAWKPFKVPKPWEGKEEE